MVRRRKTGTTTRLVPCAFIVVAGVATMGMGACPGTMTTTGGTTGGTTGTGGTTTTGTTMSAAEMQLGMDALAAMNTHRAGKALAALTWHAAGAQVGFSHSLAMQAGSFFAHIDPNTSTDPATRALNAGIMHDPQGLMDPTSGNPFVGENLFMASGSSPSGQAAVNSWVNSPGHHTQIDAPLPVAGAQTMPAWTHCGIGVRVSGDTSWWTAMFFRNPN
ncbi:MAG: CAP domain-containing protein [Phycisphaerae bacterium]